EAEYAFYYAAYFTIPHSIPLLKITNTEKVISAVVEYRSGKLIFLPFPYLEDRYKDKKHWKLNGKIYLEEIFALNEKLTSSIEDFELPQWTREFSIFNEKDIYQKLDSEKKQLEEITNSIEESVIDIKNVQRYKLLVTATGAVLEEIVKKVLTELGLAIEESEKGRSDIIATYDGLDIVCEIKGVAKSAAEKHSAQLEKWAALFYSDFGRVPKSLLIVNSYCNLPIFEREEPAFPDQMLDYAVARKHCLLTTVQLLCLFIDVIQNPDLKEERIKELLNTVGIYNRYKDPNLFLLKN
ncbi:MAG: hypothetical protein J1E41_06195, partial [Ruminococcus sp.]|nr:hypothetical protein [Ruminococcus sp.]